MSAFQAYGGAYEHNGRSFGWRCYATARVYEVRLSEHVPFDGAPRGKKWVRKTRHKGDVEFGWLVDAGTDGFSHILLQVEQREERQAMPAEDRREASRPAALA